MAKKITPRSELDDLKTITKFDSPTAKVKNAGFPVVIDRRFEHIRELGQGGNGKIYLAFDSKLQRKVALKFLLSSEPGHTQILLQEARAQAQLKHENICHIYEVGESQDQIYLVMQYIQGEPLNKIANQLNLEQKLLVIQKILGGLQQAHSQGIIHRDIKPSNILVETSNQGELKPYLIDFGLAHRDHQGEQLSQSAGQGTPSYMAPEQGSLKASEIDRRADLYSVGATLYHLLTGQPPHQSQLTSPDTTSSKNIEEYAPTPLNTFARNIPVDLQSLLLKCLKRDPNKRYSSAKSLADDIELYLNGEPIKAHRGLVYRTYKKVRKHKLLVAFASLFLLTIVTSGSWFVYQSYQQQIREQMIQTFSAKVENMEARVRFTYMAPRHDISAEIENWNKEINEIKQEIIQLGDLAYGPGHYAIGRMHYSLQEYDKALKHLQLAWNSGFQQPRVAYILALTNGEIYQRQKNIINNLPSKSAQKEKLIALDKKYRQPAIQLLEQGMQASPNQALARAKLYFYQEELEKSLNTLQQSTDFPSWFYQHKVLTGDIYQTMAETAGAAHKDKEIKKYTTLALENYQQAITIAPSDFQLQLKPITVYLTRLKNFVYGKTGNFDLEFQKSQKHVRDSKTSQPQNYQSYFYSGKLLFLKSEFENQHSGTPIKTLEQAIVQLIQASEKAPQKSDTWLALALAYTNKSVFLQNRGIDLENTLSSASNAFDKIKKTDRDYFYYNNFGSLLRSQAVNLAKENQQESLSYFERAIKVYNSASQLQPDAIAPLINSGSVLRLWSGYLPSQQAKEKLILAIEKYQRAEKLNLQHFVVNYYLGMSYRRLALIENALFEDNLTHIELSKSYLEKALKLGSQHPFAINEIAMLETDRAVYQWQQGQPYQQLIKQAKDRVGESLKKNPENHILHTAFATTYFAGVSLDYFSSKLSQKNINRTHRVITIAAQYSDTNNTLKELLQLLQRHKVEKDIIDTIQENDDSGLLLKAEWHSQNGHFDLAEFYFSQIKNIYPSWLWLYRYQHLKRWKKITVKTTSQRQITQMLTQQQALIQKHYPIMSIP